MTADQLSLTVPRPQFLLAIQQTSAAESVEATRMPHDKIIFDVRHDSTYWRDIQRAALVALAMEGRQ